MTSAPHPLEVFPQFVGLDVRSFDPDTGQVRALCPAHDDHNASLSLIVGDNGTPVLFCHAGCTLEDVYSALGVSGRDFAKAAPKRRRRILAIETPALEDQDKPLYWHDHLMRGTGKAGIALEYLTTQRGLSEGTLADFKVGFDGERITIPIRYRGKWRAVRRYRPNPPEGVQKFLNIKGFGVSLLAYVETLTGNTLPVVATEGELDALLTFQKGEGRLAVVSGTGGAGVVPRDLSALAGRELFVAYDLDDAGEAGARKFAKAARAAGARVHILDLARLGLK